MIRASKRAVFFPLLHALRDAVVAIKVVVVWVLALAEGADGGCAGAGWDLETGAGGQADPVVFGAVLGFFVAAPGFGDEVLVAEGALPCFLAAAVVGAFGVWGRGCGGSGDGGVVDW